MSTNFLNRRMDLIHEFKDGTHYLTMDTSYPVKLNGLVLKLFIATRTYKESEVKNDISFSLKSTDETGSLGSNPFIVNINKDNIFNFNNELLKDDAFVEGDYVMAVIDLFNNKLYLCSQTDFAKLVTEDDLADICNFKMFDLSEEIADRLAQAVAFQKDGIQPKYDEHFAFTRNGNTTEGDTHGDYTVYQLVPKKDSQDLEEIPVADTYTKSANEISAFWHPLSYLSFQNYVYEPQASISLCYRLMVYNALYGYVGKKFISDFCFDIDYLKDYFLNTINNTKYSLYYSPGEDIDKFTHYLRKNADGTLSEENNDYVFLLNTGHRSSPFSAYYGEIFKVRKSDGLLSVLIGADFDLKYDEKNNHFVTIDCSGENSKFAGDRWGGNRIHNYQRSLYYYKQNENDNCYTLFSQQSNNESDFPVPMLKNDYRPFVKVPGYKYQINPMVTNEDSGLQSLDDVYLYNINLYNASNELNRHYLFEDNYNSSGFNLLEPHNINVKYDTEGYYLNLDTDTFNFRYSSDNLQALLYHCLGQCDDDNRKNITFEQSYESIIPGPHGSSQKVENKISYNLKLTSTNKIFFNNNIWLTVYINATLIKSRTNQINTYVPYKFKLQTCTYDFYDRLLISKDSNNRIIIQLRCDRDKLIENGHLSFNTNNYYNYNLKDNNNEILTLYSFLKFRIFGTDDDIYFGQNEQNVFFARSINYKIEETVYNDLYIKYFSPITNGPSCQLSNIYLAGNNSNFHRVYINCTDTTNNKNYILSIAFNSMEDIFPFTTDIENISRDKEYSYCVDQDGRLVSPNNITLSFNLNEIQVATDGDTWNYSGVTVKFTFDENGEFNISLNGGSYDYIIVNDKNSDLGKIDKIGLVNRGDRTSLVSFVSKLSTGETYNLICGYYEKSTMGDMIRRKANNYLENDKLFIASSDDFFILEKDDMSLVSSRPITASNVDWDYNNSLSSSGDKDDYYISMSEFFEDGTLCNRDFGLPMICQKNGYYKYLQYIKSHSCLELFNMYKDYDEHSYNSVKQLYDNKIDSSFYHDSEGNIISIYDFFRRCLKYNFNGTLKKNVQSYDYTLIPKTEIDRTVTDCADHESIRPHHLLINKSTKTELDINGKVQFGDFCRYSDDIHADNCYISLDDKTNTFQQYVVISKKNNFNISLSNNNTEIIVKLNNKPMFTIGNSFNLYNDTNHKIFNNIKETDNYIIFSSSVPVGNIYYLYTENSLNPGDMMQCEVNLKNEDITSVIPSDLISYSGLEINDNLNIRIYNTSIIKYYNGNDSILVSLAGFNNSLYDSEDKKVNYKVSFSRNKWDYIYSTDGDSHFDKSWEFLKNKTILQSGKILPDNYTLTLGLENDNKTDNKNILYIKESEQLNINNVLSSIYIELPKKFQSTDSTIYKSVTETGLRKSQSISLTDIEGNLLNLNGIEKKEVDTLNWYDLLIALNNNQYIDILGKELINLKKTLADNPDIMQDMSDLSGIKNDISDIRDNILAKLKIIKFYHEIPEISIQESTNTVYDLATIIDNMQSLSCLDLTLPETESLITSKYYKDIKVPYYQTIGNIMNNTKVYGGHLTVFKFDDNKIYLEYINKGNDIYFTHRANIITDFNDPSIWIKKNSPKVYSEVNINLDYNKEDFIKTLSDMNPNSTLDITFPFNDDINNLDKTSIIYAGAMIFEANSRANPNFNYNINVTLNCLDEDNTQITLNSVRTDCAGMSEAIVRYLGYNVKHSPDTIGVTVADFYQMTTDAQNISSIRDKQNNVSQNFKLIPYSKDKLLPGDLIIYSGRHIEQYIYTDNDGTARGFNAGSSDSMRDSVSLAKYIAENKSVPEFSSHLGSTLNIEGLNIGLETGYQPNYILRYRYINGNNFLPYSMSDDGYLEPGGHLVISALRPNENVINVNVEFTNYRNDKYSKYLIINKIGDLNSYCTFKWLTDYVNLNKLNTILVNWHDAITTKPELTDAEKTAKTNEFKAAYEKLADDDADKKKYDTADKYAEAKLKEYIDGLDEVEKEPAKKEIIYGLSTDDSNHIIEIQSGDYKVLNFNENEKNIDKKEFCLKAYSSIEPSIIFENIKNDTTHTRLNSSKLIFNDSICIVDGKRTYNLTISNPFYNVQKSNSVNKYKEQISIRILYKRINPNIIDVTSQ